MKTTAFFSVLLLASTQLLTPLTTYASEGSAASSVSEAETLLSSINLMALRLPSKADTLQKLTAGSLPHNAASLYFRLLENGETPAAAKYEVFTMINATIRGNQLLTQTFTESFNRECGGKSSGNSQQIITKPTVETARHKALIATVALYQNTPLEQLASRQ